MQEGRDARINQSVEKALNIIELLSENKDPMRIYDIAQALDMNQSTVVRFLATLMKRGYVGQDEDTMRYYLTLKLYSVAHRMETQSKLSAIASPLLKSLSRVFGESACLAVEQDMSMVYIHVEEGPSKLLRTMNRIGKVAPMHCTGIGKLMLSQYDEAQLEKFLALKELTAFTPNTITTRERLLRELALIRRQGYAYDNEECEIGARCIAAPVKASDGRIIACISVTGPIFRLTDEAISLHLDFLLQAADEISKRVGA